MHLWLWVWNAKQARPLQMKCSQHKCYGSSTVGNGTTRIIKLCCMTTALSFLFTLHAKVRSLLHDSTSMSSIGTRLRRRCLVTFLFIHRRTLAQHHVTPNHVRPIVEDLAWRLRPNYSSKDGSRDVTFWEWLRGK